MDDMHSVNVVIDEAKAFAERHKELDDASATMGGLAMGFMRAVLECPNCPGHYRIPQDDNWNTLYCHNCGGWGVRDEAEIDPEGSS
jgi:uncharacterized protein YbaR (Trm112 family)